MQAEGFFVRESFWVEKAGAKSYLARPGSALRMFIRIP